VICHVVPYTVASGPANMAFDEALLEIVSAGGSQVYFRTYGWLEPTLSLGYFQPSRLVREDPRWRGICWVRRSSGGGAILHDRELTYALAVPAGHPRAVLPQALYRVVHEAIGEVLRGWGVEARRRAVVPADGRSLPGPRPFLCFADRDPEDLVVGTVKVVGSAQRKRSAGILQHGSLLLRHSVITPELPGVADLAEVPDDPQQWSRVVTEAVVAALGMHARPAEPDPAIETLAERLERTRFGHDSWTYRR